MDSHRLTARKHLSISNTTSIADLYQFLSSLPRADYLRGAGDGEPRLYAKSAPGKSKDWLQFQGAILILLENMTGLPIDEEAARQIRNKIRRHHKPLNVEDFLVVLQPLHNAEARRCQTRNLYSRAWEQNQQQLLNCMSSNEFNAVRKVLSRLERKFHKETDSATIKLALNAAVNALCADEQKWLRKARLKLEVNLEAFSKTTVTAETVTLLQILEAIAFPDLEGALLQKLQAFFEIGGHEKVTGGAVTDETAHGVNTTEWVADRPERKLPAAHKTRMRTKSLDYGDRPRKAPAPDGEERAMQDKGGDDHATKPTLPAGLEFFPEPPHLKPVQRTDRSHSEPEGKTLVIRKKVRAQKASSGDADVVSDKDNTVANRSAGFPQSPSPRKLPRRLFTHDSNSGAAPARPDRAERLIGPPTPYDLWERWETEMKGVLNPGAYEAIQTVFAGLPALEELTDSRVQRLVRAAIQDVSLTDTQKALIRHAAQFLNGHRSLPWHKAQFGYLVGLISSHLEPGQAEKSDVVTI
jgi:hypothetical protein